MALLAEAPATTAILAGNDLMALGCYAAAQLAGRPCPETISIVGYNDMPFVEWWRPALTTVRIPQYEIGREAARLLLEQIDSEGGHLAKQIVMPTSLTIRSSTGPGPR
jgi:LacI family transcriptional regulator